MSPLQRDMAAKESILAHAADGVGDRVGKHFLAVAINSKVIRLSGDV